MKQLKIKVTDTVEIVQPCYLSAGEVNTVDCVFDLPLEYDGLTVLAQFTTNKPIFEEIISNKCIIPPEALLSQSVLYIGVVAYESVDDTLIKRYSPTPARILINQGSFDENAQESSAVSPTLFEKQIEKMQDLIDNISNPTLSIIATINPQTFEVVEISHHFQQIKEAYQQGKAVKVHAVLAGTNTYVVSELSLLDDLSAYFFPIMRLNLGAGTKWYCLELAVGSDMTTTTFSELLDSTSITDGSEVRW